MKKTKKKLDKTQTSDGNRLWRHVADQTAPLKGRETLYVDMPDVILDSSIVSKQHRIRRAKIVQKIVKANDQKLPLPVLTHSDQPSMDKRNQQRMRQGKLAIESRVDLHGMTRIQAYRILADFIEISWQVEKRMVLVITGKGLKPDGTVGVLRTAVPRWLNESPNRERILGFSYAAPKDGGEGALYVRLKKSSKKRI